MKEQMPANSFIPIREHVIIYFMQKGLPSKIAEQFFDYFESVDWKSSKGKYINWKKEAVNWIWNEQERIRKLKKKFASSYPLPAIQNADRPQLSGKRNS